MKRHDIDDGGIKPHYAGLRAHSPKFSILREDHVAGPVTGKNYTRIVGWISNPTYTST